MADITWDDVEALQPNLSTVSAGAQTMILGYVNGELNASAFGGDDAVRYQLARCYLAAHLGELTRRDGAQDVASETIGSTAITLSYVSTKVDGDALAQTSWGRQFAMMVRLSPLRIGGGRTA